MLDVHCYAQRLLNPFRGTLQIIAYESGEAVSTDERFKTVVMQQIALKGDEPLSAGDY